MENKAPITQLQLVTKWLDYLVEREQELLTQFTTSTRRVLYESFAKAITSKDGTQVVNAIMKFRFYLRYLDMGVGRGVPVGSKAARSDFEKYRMSNGRLHKYKRKKVPVHNRPVSGQIKKLTDLLVENFGLEAIQAIESFSEKKIDIKL